jgi:hypothetical protein
MFIESILNIIEHALHEIVKCEKNTMQYNILRRTLIKEYELSIEQIGKILK